MSEFEDEIDLAELFATIFSRKWIVVACTIATVGVAGVYLTTFATPMYEAKARFELLDSSGPSSMGELGGLAALAGLSSASGRGEAGTLEGRILSRPFVEGIYDEAGFVRDPSFNLELSRPGLKTRIIRAITGSTPEPREPMERADFIGAALGYLRGNLSITVMDNGIIEVGINHKNPERAAAVSNIIVDAAIEDIQERARAAARVKLVYFAEQLAEVQADSDAATRALSDYALRNNLGSQIDLVRASTQLAALRQSVDDSRDRLAALTALRSLGEAGFVAEEFALQFPTALGVEFRRTLDWGGNAAGWTYPSTALLEGAISENEASFAAAEINITNVLAEASVTGEAAIVLAELQGNAEVQKAIYGAMIQQFEAQSFATGFETASGRLIDPAVVPGAPSSPRAALVGALSVVLGGFLGVAIALVLGLRGGRLHTAGGLQNAAGGLKSVRLPKLFGKPLRSTKSVKYRRKLMNSVAVDQIVAALPDDGTVICVLPTADGPGAAALAIGVGQKLASHYGDALILSLGDPQFDHSKFEVTAARLEKLETRAVAPDLDWAVARDVKLGEVEALISGASKAYGAVVIVPEPSSIGILQAHRVARHADALVVVGKAGATTKEALGAAVEVAKSHKPQHSILATV